MAANSGISVCMKTTLNIDNALLTRAGEYTGEKEKTALVRMGLEALIEREAARRLAALGGTMLGPTESSRRRAALRATAGCMKGAAGEEFERAVRETADRIDADE